MKLNLLVLRTAKLKELVSFYETLGMSFEYHQHAKGPFHYAVDLNGLVFEIYPVKEKLAATDTSLRLGFEISNLDEKIEELDRLGIRIVQPPKQSQWGYRSVIEDLDGRKIELIEKL